MVKKDFIRIRLYRIIVICLACSGTGGIPSGFFMQDQQSRLKIEEMIRSIPDLSASEYREMNHAFQSEFSRNGNSFFMPDSRIKSIQHIIQAGIFEEIPPPRIAEIAYKAYIAECKGSDPKIVEDLVLIGFARSISAEQLEVASKLLSRFFKTDIDPYIYQDIISYGLANGWPSQTIADVSDGLIRGHQTGVDGHKLALAMIIRMEKGLGEISPAQMVREEIAFVRSKEKKRLHSMSNDNVKDFPKPIPSTQRYSVFVESKRKEPKPVIYAQASRLQLNQNGMIESIRSYLGTPYRWGGNSRYGIDCSGFTQAVYREQGIYIPRVSRQQLQIGKPIAGENLQFGDLIFFNKYGYGTISHVGIYIGNGQFVHATTKEGMAVSSLNKRYYRIRYVGAKRLV